MINLERHMFTRSVLFLAPLTEYGRWFLTVF
jgi:hypothetical protein